ncbi:MAG: hypothetical protein Q7T81_09615 [Pseudolabrys sp.]|nr:hypothetical protein [Pseudolabrys sp.]
MSYVARTADFHPHSTAPAPSARAIAAPRRSALRWLYDAVMLSRERQTQRDIDRLVSSRDGNFNDSLEREIAERSYSGGWGFHR